MVQTLLSEVPTGPPSDVTVWSVGVNDIVFTWDDIPPCQNSAEVLGYEYELVSRYGVITGSVTSKMATFYGMNCGTEYFFRVRITARKGKGPFSEAVVVQTLMSEEPFASDLSYSPVFLSRTWIDMSWESTECPPSSFDVEYTLTFKDQCESTIPSTDLRFLSSGSSASVCLEPFASDLSYSPVFLSRTWIDMSWESTECPPSSFDVEYTLTLKDQCESALPSTDLRFLSSGSSARLENLVPFSTYIIKVTGTGSSAVNVTQSVELVTQESVPSAAPLNVRLGAVEASELEFYWQAPPCGTRHGEVHYQYEVFAQMKSPRGRITSDTSVKLQGLDSNTKYEFRVAATTSSGVGPFSNIVLGTTSSLCPDDYCLNGGMCEFNEVSEAASCSCIDGYSGTRCELDSTTLPVMTTLKQAESLDEGDLGPGALAAIASAGVIGILVTSVAVIMFLYLVGRVRAGLISRPTAVAPKPTEYFPVNRMITLPPPELDT
ncbi:receptor-type tyrosine-protein phosphatase F-like [Amphiura filiformis]|uniref:receptor-type tyrosine-protein phosphatase F-like n=1 Tax=Amphiura filiformis TaxID=82378 RepID=UPI003B2114C6